MVLMEAALRMEFEGQETINRWNFIGSGTPAAVTMSFALASAMGLIRGSVSPFYPADGYFAAITPLMAPSVIWRELVVKDVYSVTDFYTTPYINGEAGTGTPPALAPFNAYGFRTNRVRSDIARGTKRIPGVTQGATTNGGGFVSGAVTLLTALAELMGEVLVYDDEGNNLSFAPCVVSKQKYTTPSGRSAYRYYPTLTAQMDHVAQGITWEPYPTVRGQQSRQYGKGS